MSTNELNSLPQLMTLSQWQTCENKARQTVLSSLQPPKIQTFEARQVSQYPKWLVSGVIGALGVVLLGAFVISAGKQLVSYDSILSHLATSTRLSALWVTVGLIAGVLLSEVGALVFSIAAAIFGQGTHQKAFRISAFVSAGIAILGNVAVTASYQYDGLFMTALAWVLTFAAPGIVLVVALAGERLILNQLEHRSAAIADYKIACQQHENWQAQPESHPDYPLALRRFWLETYRRKGADWLENPEIISRIYNRDMVIYAANFAQLPLAGQTPSLTDGQQNN
jgi:hypothetical protein